MKSIKCLLGMHRYNDASSRILEVTRPDGTIWWKESRCIRCGRIKMDVICREEVHEWIRKNEDH